MVNLRIPKGTPPGFTTGIVYSTTLPVLGSSLPMSGLSKSEYQTTPCESSTTSWGCCHRRCRSYSVMTTCVALPFGRGSVLRGYCHFTEELRFTVLKYSATPRGNPDGPYRSSLLAPAFPRNTSSGRTRVVLLLYPFIRATTRVSSSVV